MGSFVAYFGIFVQKSHYVYMRGDITVCKIDDTDCLLCWTLPEAVFQYSFVPNFLEQPLRSGG